MSTVYHSRAARVATCVALTTVVLGGAAQSAAAKLAPEPADAAPQTSAQHSNASDPFTIVLHPVQTEDIDVGAKGESVGDYTAFTDNVLQNGKQIGRDGGICTITKITRHRAEVSSVDSQCLVTLSLPRGQITVQGLVTFTSTGPPEDAPFGITGGTGSYRTARGRFGLPSCRTRTTVWSSTWFRGDHDQRAPRVVDRVGGPGLPCHY